MELHFLQMTRPFICKPEKIGVFDWKWPVSCSRTNQNMLMNQNGHVLHTTALTGFQCALCRYFNEQVVGITRVTAVNIPIKLLSTTTEATRNLPRLNHFNFLICLLFLFANLSWCVKISPNHFYRSRIFLTSDNSSEAILSIMDPCDFCNLQQSIVLDLPPSLLLI